MSYFRRLWIILPFVVTGCVYAPTIDQLSKVVHAPECDILVLEYQELCKAIVSYENYAHRKIEDGKRSDAALTVEKAIVRLGGVPLRPKNFLVRTEEIRHYLKKWRIRDGERQFKELLELSRWHGRY